ncbi:MAG: hypothetical protein IKF91_03375 [Bacilli bacterium]|nr:hypothetical protein [Bacilli bacterium]
MDELIKKEIIKIITKLDLDYTRTLSDYKKLMEDFNNLADEEKDNIINYFGEEFAKQCEQGLKVLALDNIYEDCNRDLHQTYGRQGVKKYGHNLLKLLMEEDRLDEYTKNSILSYLGNNLKIEGIQYIRKEVVKGSIKPLLQNIEENQLEAFAKAKLPYMTKSEQQNMEDYNAALDLLIEELTRITEINKNTYMDARYAVMSDENYISNIKFLHIFLKAIRNQISVKYPFAIRVKKANRHIFPEYQTQIKTKLYGNNHTYLLLENVLIDENEEIIFKNEIDAEEVEYIQDGQEKKLVKQKDIYLLKNN